MYQIAASKKNIRTCALINFGKSATAKNTAAKNIKFSLTLLFLFCFFYANVSVAKNLSPNGEKLHQKECVTCHVVGEHTALYKRKDRIIQSRHSLARQISVCVSSLNVEWFPEEEKSVFDYINDSYYHFK